ncbi:MAG TPA: isoaspartyl peptidase/L-asparaginase [Actinomycetota bacterium]|nr:isoaspartyl peptidase/L-asparaginase [Actinomycetota bacterium]
MATPRVVVHGGAGLMDRTRLDACLEGVEAAAKTGAESLGSGALAAAVAAVGSMEANPNFNAGLGATLTRQGSVELDAAVMTGDLRFGAVGACPPIPSAIELALRVYEDGEYSLLVGEGALNFAMESGIRPLGPEDLILDRVRAQLIAETARRTNGQGISGAGTVGAVALDADGNLAAATSTGGILYKRVGRVGDTPMPGAGTYADAELGGAASATGHGESILKVLLSREVVARVATSGPEIASKEAMLTFERRTQGLGGLIVIDRTGSFFAIHNTTHMPWAACTPGEPPTSGH